MQQDALAAAQIGSSYEIIVVPSYNLHIKWAEDGTPVDVLFSSLIIFFDSAKALFMFHMWPKLMQSTESDSAALTMPLMSGW